MPTYRQLSLYGRKLKRRRCTVAALIGAPHKKGVIIKMAITTPRKPNSAKRKYAKVRIIASKKVILAHIPGIGDPGIQEYSIVLVEGGSPPDVPGINYTLMRGVYDFDKYEVFGRRKRRSKFGVVRPIILKNNNVN
jgi:small subunit ribosomal protein S12